MPILIIAAIFLAIAYCSVAALIGLVALTIVGIIWQLCIVLAYLLAVIYGGMIVAWIFRGILTALKLNNNGLALAIIILGPPLIVVAMLSHYHNQPFYESHWQWKSLFPEKVTNPTDAYNAYLNCWHVLGVAVAASAWTLYTAMKQSSGGRK